MFKTHPALIAVGAFSVAAALLIPTVSQAAELDTATVSYADLNLASDTGAQALQRRITVAARVVCGYEEARQHDLVMATKACRNDAVERARPAFEAAVTAAKNPRVIVGEAATSLVVSAG